MANQVGNTDELIEPPPSHQPGESWLNNSLIEPVKKSAS